ncbi:carbohydrate ABC transporter permease [Lachnoclostridium sp. Marseille-P6806]|uniref:carbohydrate ABC transporter permease n=1 Tax=Lachnoclostridium sp. Marseille-P6806 TaxID=2364793 RepID=UPI00102F9220|nr:sugar ABC transporter permease [Lachnoclostridium sp. Marseille-P6806]
MGRGKGKQTRTGWAMVAAAGVFIGVFGYWPTIQAFLLSFQTGKGINLKFNGAANYRRLLGDATFWVTAGNTLLYAAFVIPIMILAAMIIAVILNDPVMKYRGVYRTCIFLPCVTSMVSYSILFKYLFSLDGIVNHLLMALHLVKRPVAFIQDPLWAKFVVIVALLWRYTGYYMIFFLAALQNIDPCVYEAAKLDGAGTGQTFCRITLPLLKPIVFLTGIMALNSILQLFDEVVNLTDGGPGNATRTISEYIYDLSFRYVPSYGYAATVSFAVFILVVAITLIQKAVLRDRD